jgi:hypothetical protein
MMVQPKDSPQFVANSVSLAIREVLYGDELEVSGYGD